MTEGLACAETGALSHPVWAEVRQAGIPGRRGTFSVCNSSITLSSPESQSALAKRLLAFRPVSFLNSALFHVSVVSTPSEFMETCQFDSSWLAIIYSCYNNLQYLPSRRNGYFLFQIQYGAAKEVKNCEVSLVRGGS